MMMLSQCRGRRFLKRGDDKGWLSDTTTSCASTTSTVKSDIIEAWTKRKKKNHQKEAWKHRKKKKAAAEVRSAKAGPTPAKAGLHVPALFWP
jgi:hypothetical protein